MSLYLYPETLSDIRMEISDTTNSLDSLDMSPTLGDDDQTAIRRLMKSECSSPKLHTHQNNHNHDRAPSNADCDDSKAEQSNGDDDNAAHQLLDNRLPSQQRPQLLSFADTKDTQRNSIQRTLTSNHPLMSPNGTDSESECSSRADGLPKPQNNFPDVVPQTDRLHQPCANDISTNNTLVARHTLNNGMRTNMNNKLSATLLRAHSPDLLSSESDADVSQYHAAVNANFQTVALVPNVPLAAVSEVTVQKCHQRAAHDAPSLLARRNRKSCGPNGADDISSLDSISNHSFDDDEEHNLASLSPSSSLIDVLEDDDDDDDDEDDGDDDDDDDEDCEGPEFVNDDIADYDDPYPDATTPTPNQQQHQQQRSTTETCNGMVAAHKSHSADILPQYSAAEERRDSRNWQKITLPDGRTREIDMRVIEPYKRVLSHGGYLKAAGQNAIVIFCACHLPDRARADYNYVMDNLFLYVVKTLEQLVTDDYVLIYLHGGSNRRNVPPFPWLKKCYQLLDRRLRKSLKNMYLVHPTFWIKSIVWMARPFVSAKFWRKLVYVKSLDELSTHVAVEKAAIPEKVKQYDAKHN